MNDEHELFVPLDEHEYDESNIEHDEGNSCSVSEAPFGPPCDNEVVCTDVMNTQVGLCRWGYCEEHKHMAEEQP